MLIQMMSVQLYLHTIKGLGGSSMCYYPLYYTAALVGDRLLIADSKCQAGVKRDAVHGQRRHDPRGVPTMRTYNMYVRALAMTQS